ncbi:hypothetical protein Ahy_A07g032024 isoform E [Arachis hypogaea]|uniref:Uncharacterized protein n=1 Tax=Arachis hypogaea TaxID=3818 RepID=A0A445C5V5_ARAHY|nr:hypothetical protein Ahy_A07g032024 isoform E [Arachis hypogaea]
MESIYCLCSPDEVEDIHVTVGFQCCAALLFFPSRRINIFIREMLINIVNIDEETFLFLFCSMEVKLVEYKPTSHHHKQGKNHLQSDSRKTLPTCFQHETLLLSLRKRRMKKDKMMMLLLQMLMALLLTQATCMREPDIYLPLLQD